jgi:tricorn protease
MHRIRSLALAGAMLAGSIGVALAQVNARMLQQPDVSATHIAFVYAGDIWIVAKTGGVANRLSSPRGEESFPRFSPDGSKLAFTAAYDGNDDVYVMPAMGGDPVRVTHHPGSDRMLDWYPDGRSLLIGSPMASGRQRYDQLYRVAAGGGLPEKLPVPYGEFGAISPDGKWLAYMPRSQDFRTWKRYRGGWASDLWLYNLETGESKQVSKNPANTGQPMWHGRTLYFLSERGPEQRANIWAYSLDSATVRQVTQLKDFDIHFPATGPTDLVYEAGGRLYLMDLATERSREVAVQVVTDRATLRSHVESVSGLLQDAAISPTGQRAVFAARGDVFTVPAEHGFVRDVTQTPGVAERTPTWSPDGKMIAFWSDRSGEYELTLKAADGSGAEEKLTTLGPGFRYRPQWSPDSKKLAFVDQTMSIWLYDRDAHKATKIDHGTYMYEGSLAGFKVSWSADSRWVAYAADTRNQRHGIVLYDVRAGVRHQVTTGFYDDFAPVFDPDGKYLYFFTNRALSATYSDYDNSWIYANATGIAAAPLRLDVPSPVAPRNDDETGAAASAAPKPAPPAAGARPDSTRPAAAPAAVEIDLPGFEQRVVLLPPKAGNFGELAAVSGKVLFRRTPRTGSDDTKRPIVSYDLKDRKETNVVDDAQGFQLSHDGKKLLVFLTGKFYIIDVKPAQKLETALATDQLTMVVDPPAEWRQVFNDVWRFDRDYFYDKAMHGVDWAAMRTQYGALINDAVTRSDVNYVIGEMISELSASHTYRGGGVDLEAGLRRGVGLLGVDWSLENGAYRIKRIVDGAAWDAEARSPLALPGVNVHEGDYVLAVNGVPLDTSRDPWAAFEGLANRTVVLTVNARPVAQGAKDVVVQTLTDESRLRNLAWIEANRRRVDSLSGGRVGYIYVPSTGIDGQDELERQFQAQYDKDGLVVDERFNSGGQIPDRFIELLNRPALAFWAVRDGQDWAWPPYGHFGSKVMLINGWSGSGGDAFPYYFKEAGLGPLIGTRTWGGLIGISGVPALMDGGNVTVPTFRMYSPKGEWFPEGHGVDPDIEVVDDPTVMAKGGDPQLDRGVQEVLRQLAEHPANRGKRPAAENRGQPRR